MTITIEDVLVEARANFQTLWPEEKTNAAFDYGLCLKESNSWMAVKNAVYVLATRRMDGFSQTAREAAYLGLWGHLHDDLKSYVAKCLARKYTGWSYASHGPIRYAG